MRMTKSRDNKTNCQLFTAFIFREEKRIFRSDAIILYIFLIRDNVLDVTLDLPLSR